MKPKQYPVIFLNNRQETYSYTSPHGNGGSPSKIPRRDRNSHGQYLTRKLNDIWSEVLEINEEREAVSLPVRNGTYLEFRSQLNYELITKSLENLPKGIRLLTVRYEEVNNLIITIATIYIPEGKEGHFLRRLEDYLDSTKDWPSKDDNIEKPRNGSLINSIEDIRLAVLESFWQDDKKSIPNENTEWCEVWLRTEKNNEDAISDFKEVCQELLSIELEEGVINFPERSVMLLKANREQLVELIATTEYIAELRKVNEVHFFMDLNPSEQREWVDNLTDRLQIDNEANNTSILILDHGINNGHSLISPVLDDADMHTYDPSWGTNDNGGHGTNMAGIAIYSSRLDELLEGKNIITLNHILESGKILPNKGQNDKKLYGFINEQVISQAEIQAPNRNRIICMAVAEEDSGKKGVPSSWSGVIDSLSSGMNDNNQRLIILSAGNVVDWKNYPSINQLTSVESPGQSWNAITVGAYTELVTLEEKKLTDYVAIAPKNGLSPFSSTSILWEDKWPIKPDVLFEGGNVAINETENIITECDDFSLLTTSHRPNIKQFDTFNMTSAATAQAAWMAAQIQSQYPNAWPETIRGLMIHSAEWTEQMETQFLTNPKKKGDYMNLLRICGYGVPNLEKAIQCKMNNLVLIAEEKIQPFKKTTSGYKVNDMHCYDIPWPSDVLLDLGSTNVRMKVTLSYFIEPSPGEIGWKDKYRYRSHGLSFDVNNVSENKDEFIKRINKYARDGTPLVKNNSSRWLIGSQNRNHGSIHSDVIEGTAADLSTCKYIGIFPTAGWWQKRTHLKKGEKRTRYSLIISIETQEVEVDLYTPVAIQLKIPVEV